VRQQLHALKRFTYGKHIVARVEKLLSAGTRYQTHAKGRLLPDDEALAAAAAAAGARLSTLTVGSPAVAGGASETPGAADAAAACVGDEASQCATEPNADGSNSQLAGSSSKAGSGDGKGSDGGSSSQPPAPTTPPVSAGTGEAGYSGSVAARVQAVSALSSDGGAAAADRPCSGELGLAEGTSESPAAAEAH
jgi:hypothetical protein